MNLTLRRKVFDRRPSLRATLSMDLTGTIVRFIMGTKVNRIAVIEDAVNGKIRYDWLAADVDQVGQFPIEFQVNYPTGVQTTVPAAGYKYILFEPRLGE